MARICFLAGLATFLVRQTHAKWAKGIITLPARKAVFLSKFCFDFDPHGRHAGNWRVEFADVWPKRGEVQLAVFDDQADSYPDENAIWDFQCRSQRLNKAAKLDRIINASDLPWSLTMPLREHVRPRWWYAAVVDCSGIERQLEYSVHMTNPRKGWQQEFSMDQCGLVSLGLVLSVYIALASAQLRAITMQLDTSTRHPLRLMLFVAIAAACWSMLAVVIDGVWFSIRGENIVALCISAKFLKVFSKFVLLSMLMLLSQGICISQPLRFKDMWRVSRLLAPFFGSCLLLELWGEYAQSRTYTTGFVYCTRFGAALVFADLCMLVLYLGKVRASYVAEDEADRRRFYSFWALIYSGAFIILPFATLLSFVIAPWVRAEVMLLLTNGVHAALLASLVLGLWPEREQTFFCLDSKDLARTFGMKSDLLSPSAADASPCLLQDLRARTPKAVRAVALSGIDDPFSFAQEDAMP